MHKKRLSIVFELSRSDTENQGFNIDQCSKAVVPVLRNNILQNKDYRW